MSTTMLLVVAGLSPRVWGSPGRIGDAIPRVGSIPTGVGEPPRDMGIAPLKGVYPHGCGGAKVEISASSQRLGLSPRVWGSLHPFIFRMLGGGSIPTGVGEPPYFYTPEAY